MAKANKSISLDTDIAEKLEAESNASDLVNSLLSRYYEREIPRNLEDKIKKFQELEEKIIQQKLEQEHKLKSEIRQKKETLEKIQREKEEHKTNIVNLMTKDIELSNSFVEAVNNDPDLITDIEQLITWVDKFREKNIRVGISTLKEYYQMVLDG